MSSILTNIVAFIFAIGVLVAVHEFGHFWVARRLGIKVLRFSIGFGSPLWRRVAGRDQVEYVIATIPLGGYVKLLDEREAPVPPSEQHRAFNRAPVRNRIAVLVAGPAFNFLFAILAYWLVFTMGVPGLRPVIGEVTPSSFAAQADLRSEDEILSVGGESVQTWEQTVLALLEEMLDDGKIPLTVRGTSGVQREVEINVEGEASRLTEPGELLTGLGFEPWRPPAVLGEIVPGEAAERAGLQPGDRILSADGEVIRHWEHWREFVAARPGQTVRLEIERAGRLMSVEVELASLEVDSKIIGRIGAGGQVPEDLVERMRAEQRFGPIAAVTAAVAKTADMSALTLHMLWKMIVGEVSVKNISGPINIAEYAGYTASAGVVTFLGFLAIVSISLGILNLLPIPMLDGGQIVYQVAELVKGSPVSERTQIIGQQIGIVLLLGLMTFAFYNDIVRLME